MECFIYRGHNALVIQVPNLVTFEFLLYINSQLTTVLQMSSTCIIARMDTNDHGLSHLLRSRGNTEWCNMH